jgi:sugar lactone lactonase YvrE
MKTFALYTVHATRFAVLTLAVALATSACRARTALPSSGTAGPDLSVHRQALLPEPEPPPGSTAQFFGPTGIVAYQESRQFNADVETVPFLVVSDTLNNTIRRIERATGVTTTVAGVAGVEGSSGSLLRKPTALAIGGNGEIIVADTGNHTVRYIHLSDDDGSQLVDTVAGLAGQRGYANGGQALLDSPQGVAINQVSADVGGGKVLAFYVADTGNGVIRRVTIADGNVTLIAGTPGQQGYAPGDSAGAGAKFNRPTGLAIDSSRNILYVADTGNHMVRAINLTSGAVSDVAGVPGTYGYQDNPPALFAQPVSVTLSDSRLYVADRASYTIRRIDSPWTATATVATVAGVPWQQGSLGALLRAPSGVVGAPGDPLVYVADTGNNLIRTVPSPLGGAVGTLTGTRTAGSSDGFPEALDLGTPDTIACDGQRLIVNGKGVQVIQLDPSAISGTVRTVASAPWNRFVLLGNTLYAPHAYSVGTLDLQTGAVDQVGGVNVDDSSGDLVATNNAVFAYESLIQEGVGNEVLEIVGAGNAVLPADVISGSTTSDGTYIYAQTMDQGGNPIPPGLRRWNPNTSPPAVMDTPVDFVGKKVLGMAVRDHIAYLIYDGDPYRTTILAVDLYYADVTIFAGTLLGSGNPPTFENPKHICISGNSLFVTDTDQGKAVIRRVALDTRAITKLDLRRAQ